MFGRVIDYHLLKPLTHSRNLLTQEDFDRLRQEPHYNLEEAVAYLERARRLLYCGELPVEPGLSYLDVGCGLGELSVALSIAGCSDDRD